MVDHLSDSAMRFRTIIAVNQQVARQPVELAEKWDPQQALFAHGDGWRLHDIRCGNHIEIILMVCDIDGVAIALGIGRFAAFHFQTEQRRKAAKHMAKGRDMFWITRAEQAVNRSKKRKPEWNK